MLSVSKGVLKSKILEYFRSVERTGEAIIVTDNRKPVLKIVPYKTDLSSKELFDNFQGKVKYYAPITDPETEEWGDLP